MYHRNVKKRCKMHRFLLSATAVYIATAIVVSVFATSVIAENKQEKDDEPQNCVVTVKKTATVVATAVITKQIHK